MRFTAMLVVALLLALAQGVRAQGTITGLVQDVATGAPISAVQVFIADLDLGVLTRANGRYLMQNVPVGPQTLTAQRIGYRQLTAQVTVAAGGTVSQDFDLTLEALQLDAVIVTGTVGGTQRRAIGNVVERIEFANEVAIRPVTSMEQMLQVAVPGIGTLAAPADPGGNVRIRLRGSSSTSLSGEPVIFVDGIRMNVDPVNDDNRHQSTSRLSDIDPSDIESIEIIKGPAAATLYGTDAANGVIQIITKRGVAGAAQFDASVSVGRQWVPWLSTADYWMRNPEKNDELSRINLRETEPQWTGFPFAGEELFRNGITQDYSLSVRGGTEEFRYFASLNRNDADGTVRAAFDRRSSARVTLSMTPHATFNADLVMAVMWGERSGGRTEASNAFGSQIFSGSAVRQLGADLSHPRRGWQAGVPENWHPDVFEQGNELRRSTFSLTMSHAPTDWVTHRIIVGLDDTFDRQTMFQRKNEHVGTCCDRDFLLGDKRVGVETEPTWSLDFSGSLNFDPVSNINSVTSYGLQYYNRQRIFTEVFGRGFATPPLATVSAAGLTTGKEEFLENTQLGIYAQQQFGWRNRLFVTGAVRADDSSTFGDDFDYAIYPKFSATWVVHEEAFWDIDWMSQLRLRGAWGAAGQQPDLIAASRLYRPVTGPNGAPGVAPLSFGNLDLGPERGEELELGFDVDFFDGRLSATFTRYWRKTVDGIIASPLAPSIGFTTTTVFDVGGSDFFINLGEVTAWGTETSLHWQAMTDDPVRWDLNLAFTTMGNRIEDLGGGVERIPVPRGRDHVVGYQLASIFEKKIVSAEFESGNSGRVTNLMCDGGVEVAGKSAPIWGGDPVACVDAPQLFWGVGEPTRLATLQSTWTVLRNWQLSMLLDYKGGHWGLHEYLSLRSTSYPASQNDLLSDNPVALAYLNAIHRNALGQTRAGFARLRDVQLSYTFPSSLAERLLGADRARFYVGMNNVAYLWQAQSHVEREPLLGPDQNRADQNFGGETRGNLGYRLITVGLNVSF